MAEQKQKKAGLTISLGRRPKVLLLGNGMNRVYGGASWAGLLEKISRTSFTADQVKSMPFPMQAGLLGRAQVVTAEEERLAALGSLIDTLGDVTPEIKAQYLAKKAKNTTLLRIQPLQITGKASRSYVPVTQRMAGPGRQA